MASITTLEMLNSRGAFTKSTLDDPYYKYYITNRFTGEIKGAGATKKTLYDNCDVRCWEDYEILTRKQYKTRWQKGGKK